MGESAAIFGQSLTLVVCSTFSTFSVSAGSKFPAVRPSPGSTATAEGDKKQEEE